jgi:hypothetical protein
VPIDSGHAYLMDESLQSVARQLPRTDHAQHNLDCA